MTSTKAKDHDDFKVMISKYCNVFSTTITWHKISVRFWGKDWWWKSCCDYYCCDSVSTFIQEGFQLQVCEMKVVSSWMPEFCAWVSGEGFPCSVEMTSCMCLHLIFPCCLLKCGLTSRALVCIWHTFDWLDFEATKGTPPVPMMQRQLRTEGKSVENLFN